MKPDKAYTAAAERVLHARALEKLMRSILEPVKLDCARIIHAVHKRTGKPVTELKDLCRMSREQFSEYREEYGWELKKMGYTADKYQKGVCPLLEAESSVRDAESHMVRVLEKITGISPEKLKEHPDLYKEYTDLSLRWLVQYMIT